MTASRPQRKDVVRNRVALLAAAEDLVSTRGAEVTLNEIARHAGVGIATAYRHYSNKQDLLVALFEKRLDSVVDLLTRLQAVDDPMAALEEFLFTVGRWQQKDRGLREAMTANHGMDALGPHRDLLVPLVTRLVDRARDAGRLRPGIGPNDVPVLLKILGSVTEYSADVRPELWRRYLRMIIDGMHPELGPLDPPALTDHEVDKAMRV